MFHHDLNFVIYKLIMKGILHQSGDSYVIINEMTVV